MIDPRPLVELLLIIAPPECEIKTITTEARDHRENLAADRAGTEITTEIAENASVRAVT
jgi:hypothetical protein